MEIVLERLKGEAGYSLVEVLMTITLLTIAILPMVGMFDMGLTAATRSSNYDQARTLANLKLEQAKAQPYEFVRTSFPSEATGGNGAPVGANSITSNPVTSVEDPQVPEVAGFNYTVTKQYLEQPPVTASPATGNFTPSTRVPPDTDTKLLKVTVTVSWAGGNEFETSGVVAG